MSQAAYTLCGDRTSTCCHTIWDSCANSLSYVVQHKYLVTVQSAWKKVIYYNKGYLILTNLHKLKNFKEILHYPTLLLVNLRYYFPLCKLHINCLHFIILCIKFIPSVFFCFPFSEFKFLARNHLKCVVTWPQCQAPTLEKLNSNEGLGARYWGKVTSQLKTSACWKSAFED